MPFPEWRASRIAKLGVIAFGSAIILLFIIFFYFDYTGKSDIIRFLTFNSISASLNESLDSDSSDLEHTETVLEDYDGDVELVVASLKQQDTSWYTTYFPFWKANGYVVDDSTAPLTVPQNKGHEAIVYLLYVAHLLTCGIEIQPFLSF